MGIGAAVASTFSDYALSICFFQLLRNRGVEAVTPSIRFKVHDWIVYNNSVENITKYCKDNGISLRRIEMFLRQDRVKYLIKQRHYIVSTKRGRYGGTEVERALGDIFKRWLEKEPLPLLNRKEYEVSIFITNYYGADAYPQYKVGDSVYDWYIAGKSLLVEFDEQAHSTNKFSKNKDLSRKDCFVIKEKTVMADLAKLVKRFPCTKDFRVL